jgi:hypothetical protein
LVYAKLPATRQRELCEQSPANIAYWRARQRAGLHRLDKGAYIFTHKVELVTLSAVGGMKGYLRRRQSKDQPPAAHVDVGQLEHIA